MSTIEPVYSQAEILAISSRDLVIYSMGGFNTDKQIPSSEYDGIPAYSLNQTGITTTTQIQSFVYIERLMIPLKLLRYANLNKTKRKIGLIVGTNGDGSFIIKLMGDNLEFNPRNTSHFISHINESYFDTNLTQESYPTGYFSFIPFNESLPNNTWKADNVSQRNVSFGRVEYNDPSYHYIQEQDAFSYVPQWVSGSYGSYANALYYDTSNIDGVEWDGSTVTLTDSPATTLTIGQGMYGWFYPAVNTFFSTGPKNIGGNLFDITTRFLTALKGHLSRKVIYVSDPDTYNSSVFGEIGVTKKPDGSGQDTPIGVYNTAFGSSAYDWLPFNLILTRNESEAIRYIHDGVLPSDAFIYPYDVDNIPINITGDYDNVDIEPSDDEGADEGDGDSETPTEDGKPRDDSQPMPLVTPLDSPQSLTNNNLYWLTREQLKNFIDWFWTGATDIDSWSEVLQKIEGLYENLSQALVSIRYMPMLPEWFGGVSIAQSIILAQLEYTQTVQIINKTTPEIRQIGTINIDRYYNSFCDYSPFAEAKLYLPFHGIVDLDIDSLMGNTLAVACTYDIMSSTIQYYVYRNGYNGQLIFSTVAKMGVEIPISLQTKNERDTAVYTNVSNAVASLVGAGASIAAGNPIGLVMSTTSLASTQAMGAPFNIKGTVGEQGAFYAPTRCAVYIRRPSYNKPSNYASRVGYPTNATYTLKSGMGFVMVYNPRITFKANVYTDDDGKTYNIAPTREEIEAIYTLLEEGVVL